MISSPICQTPRVLWKAADISDDYLNWIEPLNVVIFKHMRLSLRRKNVRAIYYNICWSGRNRLLFHLKGSNTSAMHLKKIHHDIISLKYLSQSLLVYSQYSSIHRYRGYMLFFRWHAAYLNMIVMILSMQKRNFMGNFRWVVFELDWTICSGQWANPTTQMLTVRHSWSVPLIFLSYGGIMPCAMKLHLAVILNPVLQMLPLLLPPLSFFMASRCAVAVVKPQLK